MLDRMGRNPLQLAESKLKLLQKRNNGANFMQIQCEVLQVNAVYYLRCTIFIPYFLFDCPQVVEMLKTYLEKTGQDDVAELMKSFSERLTLQGHQRLQSVAAGGGFDGSCSGSGINNNNEDVGGDMETSVKELLASLTALNLKKESEENK